ncbi:low molecular weight phosphotyrosine protein phosphatase [Halomonas sp. 18H]|uniref:low molecular weight protein-tyrosine-phosphatase n=1 Tax=Halomonas almeriensis TaxID=308163 RepID=UPI002230456D|nr:MULTISPECIES: low molecular weight protein-tyrosine-phosphatase [Halomonas]MCW4151683.1 low molecular weight phosphotyrosine protein phosphatase [Halomonas sp. 18H]MDN3552819.1 low molecular weight protein-tyrosine-phosphatase [Halomonas almeriensis]
MIRVLFVCLGNICRSPTAEGMLRHKLEAAGLADRVEVDSCGVGAWHVGEPPDPRARKAAAGRGLDIEHLRGRTLTANDFASFDYLLAMDHDNLAVLQRRRPAECRAHVGLFLDFAGLSDTPVPDPYFGGERGFEEMMELLDRASEGLMASLRERLEASS